MSTPASLRNAVWRFLVLAVVAFAVLVSAAEAAAGIAGRHRNVNANLIYNNRVTLYGKTSYTIETIDLSPGADTVLYVWNTGSKTHIASNDDCPGGGYRSCVQIAADPTYNRPALILVRAYDGSKSGTAKLKITPSPGTSVTYEISFTAGYSVGLPAFGDGTHFFTVQEQGGVPSTVLLVEQSAARPLAIDDVSGLGAMSFVHVNGPCTGANCRVYVGSYSSSPSLLTTLIWDEDMHKVPTQDPDGDGLSNALEAVLGTNPNVKDTDGDGIHDGAEVGGMAQHVWLNDFLTRFPYMGADPLKKDVWLQADWVKHDNLNDLDRWQMKGHIAEQVAAIYAPEIRLHIDIGRANQDPATRSIWGAWGGAKRIDAFTSCPHLGVREGSFHEMRLKGESGGSGQTRGKCSRSGSDFAAVIAHELGHNFNLWHGPVQSGGFAMNCAPNYRSVMNYCYAYSDPSPRFSRNELANSILYPTALVEVAGLNTTDPDVLAVLQDWRYQYKVNTSNGAIDWNRDGEFYGGLTRAAPAWAHWADIGYSGSSGAKNEGWGSAIAWLGADGLYLPGSPPSGKLYWFTRRLSDNALVYRVTTYADITNNVAGGMPVEWAPKARSSLDMSDDQLPANVVANAPKATTEPAAAWYSAGLLSKRLFVFSVANGSLYAQSIGNSGSWSTTTLVGPAEGDPAAINHNGVVHVFVRNPSGSKFLIEYTYAAASGWSSGGTQSAGTAPYALAIKPSQGIGATSGYVRTNNGYEKRLVGLVPMSTGKIDFLVQNPNSGFWEKQSSMWPSLPSSPPYPITESRPSIAYVPFDVANPSVGRYYMSWRDKDSGLYYITHTEGNDMRSTATTKRLIVDAYHGIMPVIWNVWHYGLGSISLLYELGFDANLRAAWTFEGVIDGVLTRYDLFSRVTDQIYEVTLKDQNDMHVITNNLRCFIPGAPCPL
ncbi:MAG: hypothetical protein FWD57_04240 [Polyangiaceae bacterium]|nr:hypothetical protein [Polyangiaceae bacterium]